MIKDLEGWIIMKKKWIIIRIETKSREFTSKCLLAYKLCMYGYGVIITNKLGVDIEMFPKGIYLINCLFANGYGYVKRLKKYGHKVAFLNEEGLVYINEERFMAGIDRKSVRLVDAICCYGKEQAEIIEKYYPEVRRNIFVTGNPRMNLLNDYLRPLLINDVDDIKKRFPKYILVVSNFTIANIDGAGTSVEEKRNYVSNILEEMKVETKEVAFEHFDYTYNQMKSMQELIKILHEKYEELTIIIRPHPSEDINTWIKFAQNMKNVYVIREGALNPWLLNAELVIQNNCTSAIESLYMKVPCISYRPIVDKRFDQPLPNYLSQNVFTKEEVISIVNQVVIEGKAVIDFETYLSRANNYIANQEMDYSVDALIHCFEKLNVIEDEYSIKDYKRRRNRIAHIKYSIKETGKTFIKKIPDKVLNSFPQRIKGKCIAVKQDNKKAKYADICAADVKEVFDEISKIYGKKTAFEISPLGEEILITKAE